jgi:hypothetical protein
VSEQLKFQARLAGAEVKDKPSKCKKKEDEDEYGKMLEMRNKMKDAAYTDSVINDCSTPLGR